MQRPDASITRVAASPASGRGHGRGSRRPATIPTLSTGVPDGAKASPGQRSRHSTSSSHPSAVVPKGWLSNQPDHELPHDLEHLQSVICDEIQQALTTAVSQTINTLTITQLAPPSSLALAAQTTPPPPSVAASVALSSQQTGQLALTPDCLFSGLCVCMGGYAEECKGSVHKWVDVGVRGCLGLCVYAKVQAGASVDVGASWAPWGVHVSGCICCRYSIPRNTGQ